MVCNFLFQLEIFQTHRELQSQLCGGRKSWRYSLVLLITVADVSDVTDKCPLPRCWWFFKRFSLTRLELPDFLICAAVEIEILLEWTEIRLARWLFLQKTPIIIFSAVRCTRGSFKQNGTRDILFRWFFFACVVYFILKRSFSCSTTSFHRQLFNLF